MYCLFNKNKENSVQYYCQKKNENHKSCNNNKKDFCSKAM